MVDRYLRLKRDKKIPDSAEPRLESFYPPFVTGIDLSHKGVVDSYDPLFPERYDSNCKSILSEHMYWIEIMSTSCDISFR